MSKKILICIGVAMAAFAYTNIALADQCDDVTNTSFTVAPAPANAGPAAGFAGKWSGIWTVQLGGRHERHPATFCAKLYVSVKGPDAATVVYCTSGVAGYFPAGCNPPLDAAISGDRLSYSSHGGIDYTFTLAGGTLTGAYQSRARLNEPPYTAQFNKVN